MLDLDLHIECGSMRIRIRNGKNFCTLNYIFGRLSYVPVPKCLWRVGIAGVCEEYRNQGIAGLLLENLIAHLTSETFQVVKALYLHVLTTNSQAISFYEHRWAFHHNYYILSFLNFLPVKGIFTVLRIRILFLRIRILEFFSNPDPDPGHRHIFSKAITKFWEKYLFSTKKVGTLSNREL